MKKWNNTRELFTDWVADFGEATDIKKDFQYKGFSLWWASKLVHKDSEVDYYWYKKLHNRLNSDVCSDIAEDNFKNNPLRMLILFFVDIARLLIVKLFIKKTSIHKNRVRFLSYQYNLISPDCVYDRQYSDVPLQDYKYGYEAEYFLVLNIGKKDILHPFSYLKRLRSQINDLQRNVVVLDTFLKFRDLISVYYTVFKSWLLLRQKKSSKKYAVRMSIDGKECSDILYPELEKSFFGEIQRNLLVALMVNNAVKSIKQPVVVVTYGELLAANRPVYYFVKKNNPGSKFVSIQHATVYRNKLGFYHRKHEFLSELNPSPYPDYYFVHGLQFGDILKEYYPKENIKIIGCLKYDKLYDFKSNMASIKAEINSKVNKFDGENIVLLAPSVNDVEDIISCLQDIKLPEKWRIVISLHPIIDPEKIKRYIEKLGLSYQIEFYLGVPTQKLLTVSDLVVCGYSTVALEAAVFGVPSVRILLSNRPPLTEGEKGVAYCYSKEEFKAFFDSFVSRADENMTVLTDKLVEDYFYKIDGKVHERFWQQLPMVTVN